MCMALYIRDSMLRDIPMGAETPREVTATLKSQVYEEIKRELMEGRPEDLFADDDLDLLAEKDSIMPGVMFANQRKNHKLKIFYHTSFLSFFYQVEMLFQILGLICLSWFIICSCVIGILILSMSDDTEDE